MAEDLKNGFPELSVVNGENTDVTDDNTIQPQNINGEYTMLLLKAIQELNAKVEELTTRIIALES